MNDEFLNKLKDSLEKGEFNSDAAKKINEISKKADQISENASSDEIAERINDKIKESGEKEKPQEDEIPEINSEYEKEMERFKLESERGVRIAEILNIDNNITNEIISLMNKIQMLRNDFEDLGEMKPQIDEVENKYKTINI